MPIGVPSILFRGRPRSMILPESDCPLLCDDIGAPHTFTSISAFEARTASVQPWDDAAITLDCAFSQGVGEQRDSAGADIGVGTVEAVICVVADIGVRPVLEAERGV